MGAGGSTSLPRGRSASGVTGAPTPLRIMPLAVAAALSGDNTLSRAVADVVTSIGQELACAQTELWLVDATDEEIASAASWTAPPANPVTTLAPVGRLPRGQSLPGRIWSTARPVWATDITHPSITELAPGAARLGARAAWGLPIISGDQVLGALILFARRIDPLDEAVTVAIDSVLAQLGQRLERHRAENLTAELQSAHQNLARVVKLVQDNIWSVEILADGTSVSVFASPDGAGVFGGLLPRDGDMATMMIQRTHHDDQPLFMAFHQTLAAGQPAEIENRIIGLDGVTRWVWTRAVPRRENARLFVDGISTNVTDRHRLAEEREQVLADQRQQVDKLRELDRMKDDLVALVSHELRTPIATIRGCVELLRDAADLNDQTRSLATVIDRQSAQLQVLVDDLLALAEIEAGAGAAARPCSVTDILNETVADHRWAADRAGMSLVARIDEGLRARVDRRRVRQALDNLLSNAVKYNRENGTVEVTAARQDGQIVIQIADTGIGVDPQDYPRLFARFFRARTALERNIKGTGLGLAIVRAIVEAHNGSIRARPRAGGGTCMELRIPVEGPPPP
ncbi:hypothetical protein GCM10010201_24980 [Pilimelia columellifera subsp. columellifera]|uniref:histidine kinase n=2 Tax=Pilimelia TaxID=53370 RepID=A0ABP6AWZ8_9ACTN